MVQLASMLGSLLGQESHKFIQHVSFSSDGKTIRGEAQITAAQLSDALDMAGAFLADRAPLTERQTMSFNSISGVRSASLKSIRIDAAAPTADGAFFSFGSMVSARC